MTSVAPGSDLARPIAPPAAAARVRHKPASYKVALLLILGLIVAAQVVAESVVPLFEQGRPSTRALLLLGVGGSALLGLAVLNARWLWATIGNLRFALALITVWAVASILGTLVVQRFPNQTDTGYARTFLNATGDFLWNVTHMLGGTVLVRPEPDVQAWLAEQRRIFGDEQGAETEKTWRKGEEGRLRQMEIEEFTRENDALLRQVLAVVSALRLPEAFQISVWFKALLGLLCVALVSVVIQRWRGEWRQVGWAMAHFGMVIFIVGASVRALGKVDGLLPMHVGSTTDWYYRNVTKAEGPYAYVTESKQTIRTPLDFDVTLHRFKTEYPKHLGVTLAAEAREVGSVSKTYRLDDGWAHPFLDGQLSLVVDRMVPDAEARRFHREAEAAGAAGAPAVLLALSGAWLQREEELALHAGADGLAPPDNGYHLQYARAADEAAVAGLTGPQPRPSHAGQLQSEDGALLGEARPGAEFSLPGEGNLTATVIAVWPDYARRAEPDAALALPNDPVAQLELRAAGQRVGEAWAFTDRMSSEGAPPQTPSVLLDYDLWSAPAPLHYRLVDRPDGPLLLATFRDGQPLDVHALEPGEEIALGGTGDRVRVVDRFERYTTGWVTGRADTAGMTPEDVYYASLPTAVELTVRGAPVEGVAAHFLHQVLPSYGIVSAAAFARGEGSVAATEDGRGLHVRLLSDHPDLSRFPDELVAYVALQKDGRPLPFVLDWFTNERGAPLRFTSDVTLSQGGTVLKRGLVEPNRPIYLAGFQLSQADFNPEDPSYSAFGVVRDPSVRIVYFGMGVVVLGVILLFYVFPLIARRTGGRSLP